MQFSRLIEPLSTAEFLTDWWEKKPLVLSREEPGFYGDVFREEDLDQLLVQSRPVYPSIRVLSKASGFAWDELSEGWLQPGGKPSLQALHAAYANGHSVVVEMRRLWPAIDRLCRSAEVLFHHKASAELYLTPKGSQAFDIHYDLHDVFLLQLEGSKEWQIYDPVFPFPTSDASPSQLCGGLVGEPIHKVRVKKGDLLYMPRGFPHQGLTSDEPSLHITIGIYPFRMQDLVANVLTAASLRHEGLRHSLPAGFMGEADRTDMKEQLRACLKMLEDDDLADIALDNMGRTFLAGLDPLADGQFRQLDGLAALNGDTVIEKRDHMLCLVRVGADRAEMQFPGGSIEGPAWLENSFRGIAAAEAPFRVADIPGTMSVESKVVLARRLVKDGLFRVT